MGDESGDRGAAARHFNLGGASSLGVETVKKQNRIAPSCNLILAPSGDRGQGITGAVLSGLTRAPARMPEHVAIRSGRLYPQPDYTVQIDQEGKWLHPHLPRPVKLQEIRAGKAIS